MSLSDSSLLLEEQKHAAASTATRMAQPTATPVIMGVLEDAEAEPAELRPTLAGLVVGAIVARCVVGKLVATDGAKVGEETMETFVGFTPRGTVGAAVRRSVLLLEAEPVPVAGTLGITWVGAWVGAAPFLDELRLLPPGARAALPPRATGIVGAATVAPPPCMNELNVGTRVGKKEGVAGRGPQ